MTDYLDHLHYTLNRKQVEGHDRPAGHLAGGSFPHRYRGRILISLHPEIGDFWMKHSAFSGQRSAKDSVIMRFFLKAESEMLIALIRK
jgi:hypothetical protein